MKLLCKIPAIQNNSSHIRIISTLARADRQYISKDRENNLYIINWVKVERDMRNGDLSLVRNLGTKGIEIIKEWLEIVKKDHADVFEFETHFHDCPICREYHKNGHQVSVMPHHK